MSPIKLNTAIAVMWIIGGPQSFFIDKHSLFVRFSRGGILKADLVRVWKFGPVTVKIATAHRDNVSGMRFNPESSASVVDVVNPIVADLAGSKVTEPIPVGEKMDVMGNIWDRTEPNIVVKFRWWIL